MVSQTEPWNVLSPYQCQTIIQIMLTCWHLEALKQAADTLIQNTNNFIQENAFEKYCQRLQNGNNVFHASMFFSRLYFPCSAPRCNPSNYKNLFEMKTRTKTPAFWGYPPAAPWLPILLTKSFWIPSPYYWPVHIGSQVKRRWKPKKLDRILL